jgi:hypothetical protein
MRAHTITTNSRPRLRVRRPVVALTLGICALAIPASASASETPDSYSSVNAITGGSSGSGGSGDVVLRRDGSAQVDSGYSSPNATLGPSTGEPTFVSDSPATTGNGFDWASAAVGAGAAIALVALCGAALLTARRRGATSHAPAAS